MTLPTWSIKELQTRYSLEPTLDDIFVEGIFDKELIDAALKNGDNCWRPVYTIDSVDVCNDILTKHGLTSGNRQRNIALCRELDLPRTTSVSCLIDRDFDFWHNPLQHTHGLVLTEFCDMEVCFFNENTVKQLIVDAGRSKIEHWGIFFSSFKKILRTIFSFRLTLFIEEIKVKLVDITRCITIKNSCLSINFEDYANRCLNGYVLPDKLTEIIDSSDNWCKKLENEDHRSATRGHDFLELMCWVVKKTKGTSSFSKVDSMSRVLILLVPNNADFITRPL